MRGVDATTPMYAVSMRFHRSCLFLHFRAQVQLVWRVLRHVASNLPGDVPAEQRLRQLRQSRRRIALDSCFRARSARSARSRVAETALIIFSFISLQFLRAIWERTARPATTAAAVVPGLSSRSRSPSPDGTPYSSKDVRQIATGMHGSFTVVGEGWKVSNAQGSV